VAHACAIFAGERDLETNAVSLQAFKMMYVESARARTRVDLGSNPPESPFRESHVFPPSDGAQCVLSQGFSCRPQEEIWSRTSYSMAMSIGSWSSRQRERQSLGAIVEAAEILLHCHFTLSCNPFLSFTRVPS
jgi:hypothetical protein